jgi:integrase
MRGVNTAGQSRRSRRARREAPGRRCLQAPVQSLHPVLSDTDTRAPALFDAMQDAGSAKIEVPIYLTAAVTGLRQGELLGLHWQDVDFEAKKGRVFSPYVRGEFGDPKSDGSGALCPPR